MSVDLSSQKLQQDILNELVTTNQLLQQISHELHQIKQMTNPSGEFAENIVNNTTLVKTLAELQQIDIGKVPLLRMLVDNQNSHLNTT